MATYRVRTASQIRGCYLLGVELLSDEPSNVGMPLLAVEGKPGRLIEVRISRIVFDDDSRVSNRRILVVEPPGFPAEELVGTTLKPSRGE